MKVQGTNSPVLEAQIWCTSSPSSMDYRRNKAQARNLLPCL